MYAWTGDIGYGWEAVGEQWEEALKDPAWWLMMAQSVGGSAIMMGAPRASFARESGILRDALKGQGNYSLGVATRAEAQRLGEAFVGPGYRLSSNGKAMISADGLRQYRFPTWKGYWQEYQANFERRLNPRGVFHNNGHLTVTD